MSGDHRTSFIVFVSDLPPADEVVGGEQVRPHELVRWFRRAGLDARVFCVRPKDSCRETNGGVRIASLLPSWLGVFREPLVIPAVLLAFAWSVLTARRTGATPVLWHRVPGGVSWKAFVPILGDPGWVCIPLARLLRVPVWASNHDISPDHEIDKIQQLRNAGIVSPDRERRQRRSARANAAMQRYALPRATLVSAVSEGTRKELVARYQLDEAATTTVSAGVEVGTFANEAPWVPPRTTWRVGYIGSFADADTAMLIDTLWCLAEDNNVSFLLAGRGFEQLDRQRLPPNVQVDIRPSARYGELAAIANEVDIWLVPLGDSPYQRWAWPLKIPMYLASGRPVVITNHPELNAAGVRPYVFVSDAESAAAIAATVRSIIEDPDDAASRARSAKAFTLETMSWDRQFGHGLEALMQRFDRPPAGTPAP